MVLLIVSGILLLLGGPLAARAVRRPHVDPVAFARILQLIGAALLLTALLLRPSNPETNAIPSPPDVPARQ